MILEEIKTKLSEAKGKKDLLTEKLQTTKDLQLIKEKRKISIENIQALIQQTAKETQQKLKYHIEDIVNTALDSCFPGEYDFNVSFEIKRGRTEAELFLLKEGERMDPMIASGGGVVDIISFALRLSAWALSKTDNVIILDEPFKFLSVNLRPLAGEILKQLSEKMKLQIIMVTHDNEMINIANRIFEVKIKHGKSLVVEKENE
jgi:DNA repair exonuclease SbcCD ATPase subunit